MTLADSLPDPDIVFAYDTVKLLRVLDRRLGLVFYVCQVIIIVYFVFMLVGKKEYLEKEKATGWITCQILNTQRSNIGEPSEFNWDVYDRVTNPGELGAIFIPTRIVKTSSQEQGHGVECPSPLHVCTTDEDCIISNTLLASGVCNQDVSIGAVGQCMRSQWCPAEDVNLETTQVYDLEFDTVEIWFETFVHYHKFHTDVATTDERRPREFPMKKANTYPMHDIVRMAKLDDEDIAEHGAVIIMNAIFECDLDKSECDSRLEAANIDTQTGFNHVWNNVYYEDGVRKRDTYRMYGVRFVAFATGLGKMTSMPMVITQIASFLALCTVATAVADGVMLVLIPEKTSYRDQKIIETEDFND